LNLAKIIQSLNLNDAIIDDNYSQVHLVSSMDTIHADSFKNLLLAFFSNIIQSVTASSGWSDVIFDRVAKTI
jgi:predicted small integral membrane protein